MTGRAGSGIGSKAHPFMELALMAGFHAKVPLNDFPDCSTKSRALVLRWVGIVDEHIDGWSLDDSPHDERRGPTVVNGYLMSEDL